jgi:hypothetical protein
MYREIGILHLVQQRKKAGNILANTKNKKIMKKLIIAVVMTVLVGRSAFAADTKEAAKVSYRIKTDFETRFSGATNVSWTVRDNYTKVAFTLAEQPVEAFFSHDGELIASSRKVEFGKLPLNAIQTIQKKYSTYTVSESIEFDQDGDKNYFVSLQNGSKKQILQVSVYGSVTRYPVK